MHKPTFLTRASTATLAFASILACSFILSQNLDFWVDDAFISFRYGHNWLSGTGLVFNAGKEAVEGYSNLLFLLLTALIHKTGLSMLDSSRLINLVSIALIFLTSIYYINHYAQARRHRAFITCILIFLLASSYPLILWGLGGLEGPLHATLLFIGCIALLFHFERKPHILFCLISGTCFGLSTLTRPEGLIFAGVSGLFLLHSTMPHWRHAPKHQLFNLSAFALPVCFIVGWHFIFRYYHYGEFLPNTYYAKVYGLEIGFLKDKGIQYLLAYLTAPPYLLGLAILSTPIIIKDHIHRLGNTLLLTMAMVYCIYLVRVGGDWMPTFRLIVPIIPILALLMVRIITYVVIRTPNHLLPVITIGVIMVSISQITHPYIKYRPQLGFSHHAWKGIATFINQYWPKGSTIAINMGGFIPYNTPNHHYLDMLGLNDKVIARRTNIPLRYQIGGNIGHMKGSGSYIMLQQPDYIITGSGFENNTISDRYLSEYEIKNHPDFANDYVERRIKITTSLPEHVQEATGKKRRSFTFVYYERVK